MGAAGEGDGQGRPPAHPGDPRQVQRPEARPRARGLSARVFFRLLACLADRRGGGLADRGREVGREQVVEGALAEPKDLEGGTPTNGTSTIIQQMPQIDRFKNTFKRDENNRVRSAPFNGAGCAPPGGCVCVGGWGGVGSLLACLSPPQRARQKGSAPELPQAGGGASLGESRSRSRSRRGAPATGRAVPAPVTPCPRCATSLATSLATLLATSLASDHCFHRASRPSRSCLGQGKEEKGALE